MMPASRLFATLAFVGSIAAPAYAETDVSDRLQPGGPALILEGALKHGQVERFVFTLRRTARVSAVLSGTNHSIVILQLLRADDDPNKHLGSLFTYRIEGQGETQVRYAVLVRWHPHVMFEALPPPSPYRIELKVD